MYFSPLTRSESNTAWSGSIGDFCRKNMQMANLPRLCDIIMSEWKGISRECLPKFCGICTIRNPAIRKHVQPSVVFLIKWPVAIYSNIFLTVICKAHLLPVMNVKLDLFKCRIPTVRIPQSEFHNYNSNCQNSTIRIPYMIDVVCWSSQYCFMSKKISKLIH